MLSTLNHGTGANDETLQTLGITDTLDNDGLGDNINVCRPTFPTFAALPHS